MGAVAITDVRRIGNWPHVRGRVVLATVTMSSSYATGGDTVAPSALGLSTIEHIAVVSKGTGVLKIKAKAPKAVVTGAGLVLAGTPAAPKIQAFVGSGTPAEVGAAANLSTTTTDVYFVGRPATAG